MCRGRGKGFFERRAETLFVPARIGARVRQRGLFVCLFAGDALLPLSTQAPLAAFSVSTRGIRLRILRDVFESGSRRVYEALERVRSRVS